MRILLTVDPEIPVPPVNYGGIERIVHSLAKGYSQKGHEVVLLANPESKSEYPKHIIGWKALSSIGRNNIITNALHLKNVSRKVKPDVIHSFSRLLYLYPLFLSSRNIPVLQSYQREISNQSTFLAHLLSRGKIRFSACGEHLIHSLKTKSSFTPIYNFTDTDFFSDDASLKKDHFLFLGRIEDIKGTHEAILAAKKAGEKLLIAGNIPPGKDHYFQSQVKPFLSEGEIEYVGPVNDVEKRKLLQSAKGFVFPIKWEEPFGIVMAEAMACGVPVIAFNRGSVPEVVQNNITGFIVKDVDSMASALKDVDSIDRAVVRKEAEKKFSLEAISQQYVSTFERIIES